MSKTNLTTKNISEFKKGDSLYIRVGTSDFPSTALAEFLGMEKGRVKTRVLSVGTNPELHRHRINEGWEATVAVENCALYGWDDSLKFPDPKVRGFSQNLHRNQKVVHNVPSSIHLNSSVAFRGFRNSPLRGGHATQQHVQSTVKFYAGRS